VSIVLDVLTHLDERSVAETSRQLKSHFEEGGHEAGEKFGGNMLEGVMAGFHGGDFESLSGVFESAGIAAKASRSGEAVGLAFASGITVAAGAALVDLGVKVGETFESINRQIELHTAASGRALDDLKSHADALVGSLDSSSASLGTDMATLATRLQMTAGPALDQLTQHVEMLRDRFGEINTGALAGAFRNLGVDGAQADNTLASLVETSRRYSVALPDMVNNLAGFSSVFSELHLSAEQSANVLGEVEANGVPAAKAITGLEAAMKTAKDQGQDFTTFVRRAAESIEYYERTGNEAAAQAISVDVFGTRKWADADQAARAYLDTIRQSPQAFAGHSQQLDDLTKQTRNLHNEWEEVQNKIKAALAPVALNVVDDVSQKMDSFISWLSAHQQDLEKFFSAGISTIETVVDDVGQLATLLGRHPALIGAVTTAFEGWAAIRGISAVANSIEGIVTMLRAIPGAAAVAGTAIEGVEAAGAAGAAGAGAAGAAGAVGAGGLALADVPAGVLALPFAALGVSGYEAWKTTQKQDYDAAHPGFTDPNAKLKPFSPTDIFGGAGAPAGPGAPPPGPGPAQPPLTADQQKMLAVLAPGMGGHPGAPVPPGPGAGSVAAGPDQTGGGPPSDLLTPADLDPHKGAKGPRLPGAPEVPYPAGYGAAPAPGETAEQYGAEQKVLEDRHAVAEAQARLIQLEHDNNAKGDDITKARNDLLKAQGEQNSSELRLYQEQTKQLGEHSKDMDHLGAEIDKDFGVSKGLAGIADNLTKFLGNLMMAGPLAALNQIVNQSGVRQSAPGAGGLMGMAAVSGMFGPQFMAGGSAVPGGTPQGPFGGYPGARASNAAGAYTGGFGGIAMPAGDKMTYTTGALAALGLSPLAQNPSGGGNPVIPGWVQDFVHEHGGPGLTAGSSPHGSLHGNPGGPDYAVDVTGAKDQQDRLAEFLQAHPELSAMMIHQSQISGEDYGIAGGQNVPKGTYFTTPGGTYADEGPMVHWAPSIRPGAQGPLQGSGAIPGPSMSTDASGAVIDTPRHYSGGGEVVPPSQWGKELAHAGSDIGDWTKSGFGWLQQQFGTNSSSEGHQIGQSIGNAPKGSIIRSALGALMEGGEGFSSGGGPKGTDTIPAWLSPGEEVAQASAVQKYGAGTYDALNKGQVDPASIRYLSGGTDGPLQPGQTQGPTQIGGRAANAGEGSGMSGGGGGGGGAGAMMSGLAAGAGAGAATAGIGLAAQIGMQEAQRGLQYAGAVGGIIGQGLMETFLPTGASQLAQNSWLTKIAGGLMGAQPQIPNTAGKSQNKSPEGISGMGPSPMQPPGPDPAAVVPSQRPQMTPDSVAANAQTPPQGAAHSTKAGQAPGPGGTNAPAVWIQEYHAQDKPDTAGQDIARHTQATNGPSRGTSQWT
jgi:hypothetical protein